MARPERRFVFRLALALGRTVAELLQSIGARELAEWRAYWTLEPFGPLQDSLRAAMPACVTANAYRRRGATPFEPADFFPELRSERPRQSAEAMLQQLRLITPTSAGGAVPD